MPCRLAVIVVLLATMASRAFSDDSGHFRATARTVEVTLWAGFEFGGAVGNAAPIDDRSLRPAAAYGAGSSFALNESWRIEALYSRQPTRIAGGLRPSIDIVVERYLAGVQEEVGESERVRWFGSAWLGVTRFVPGLEGVGSEARFTAGLGLGVKTLLARNFGLRFEARGFFTNIGSELGVFCDDGACLLDFAGSGLWQGDVSGGAIVTF